MTNPDTTNALDVIEEALSQSIMTVSKFREMNQITEKGKDYLVEWRKALSLIQAIREDVKAIDEMPTNTIGKYAHQSAAKHALLNKIKGE